MCTTYKPLTNPLFMMLFMTDPLLTLSSLLLAYPLPRPILHTYRISPSNPSSTFPLCLSCHVTFLEGLAILPSSHVNVSPQRRLTGGHSRNHLFLGSREILMHVRRRHSYNASCRSEYLGIRCGSLSSAQHNCALGSWATCGNPACAPILGCDGCNRVHHCSGE